MTFILLLFLQFACVMLITAQLVVAEAGVEEARHECEAVVEEWRDPDLRAAYGVERLQMIREQAKAALVTVEQYGYYTVCVH
jgi:hypothetical protein